MSKKIVRLPKTISVFTLAMINVAAIGSVKNWPLTAEYGFSSLFFLLLAALIFFLPISLIAAELATGWPKLGGIYVWVKEAFGHRLGFLSVWLLWVENMIWYPTVLSFIAATIAYIFNPKLANNNLYNFFVILIIFWATTLVNLLGMRLSGWISTIGAVCGTFIPGILIIALGATWFFSDRPMQISMSWDSFLPNLTSLDQLVFFTGILLGLAGMEMSAIHAIDVKHPQRDFPRAILLSALIIIGLSALGVLSIAIVLPQKEISLVAGAMQALAAFLQTYGFSSLIPIFAVLVAIGAIGSMSTWTVGPSKGLLAAAHGGDLPPLFKKVNKEGMPFVLLITQACIVTLLSCLFLFMPTVSSVYWILTVLVAQLYIVMYFILFIAAIKLRYSKPKVVRAYKIPGGNLGIWIVSCVGIIGALFAFIIGFLPPAQIATGNATFYVSFLAIGIILTCSAPWLIGSLLKKPPRR